MSTRIRRPDPIEPTTIPSDSPVSDEESSHPAFAMASVGRGSYGGAGAKLHDSDILHHETITLTIHEAVRYRSIKRDWHHPTKIITEVEMSLAQWASLVSSMNTTGVPVTLRLVRGAEGKLEYVPGIVEEPRLGETMREAKAAARTAFEHIIEYADRADRLVEEKAPVSKIREALHDLRIAIKNSTPNVDYASKTLAEHAENVVQKARADIEAMVVQHASRLGIDPGTIDRKELMS